MNLERQISSARNGARPFRTTVLGDSILEEWQRAAGRIDRDRRDAWRSFYVACAVVGVLLSVAIWQRFGYRPVCVAPVDPAVMTLESTEIRASGSEVYEL